EAAERRAVDVLEDHHELAVEGEEVEEADDRGMGEARVRGGLAGEHARELLVVPVLREEELQDDGAFEAVRALRLREEDVARSAGREASDDAVAADALDRAIRPVHGHRL